MYTNFSDKKDVWNIKIKVSKNVKDYTENKNLTAIFIFVNLDQIVFLQ